MKRLVTAAMVLGGLSQAAGCVFVAGDDPEGDFDARANTDMVDLSRDLDDEDVEAVRRLVENHAAYTGSERARALLDDWETARGAFVKVMADAYREAIADRPEADARRSLPEQASTRREAAFGEAD